MKPAARPTLIFFSLQGLGDSILNFPILERLKKDYAVEVVCFNNGSSAFFKAFHPAVIGVHGKLELLKRAREMTADAAYICYPTWRRELSAALLSPAPTKFFLTPAERPMTQWFWSTRPVSRPWAHQLENNIDLLTSITHENFTFDALSAFQISPSPGARTLTIHPTASTVHKYYPLEFWRDFLVHVRMDFDHITLLCGAGEDERQFCAKIQALTAIPSQVVAGAGFEEVAQLIADAGYFVGSDSALMHLAALLDRPLLGLWSFADYRTIFPYGAHASVYIPRETLTARDHSYPTHGLPYLLRASGGEAARIVHGEREPDFEIRPRAKTSVKFYSF